jgi:hypothetical protein
MGLFVKDSDIHSAREETVGSGDGGGSVAWAFSTIELVAFGLDVPESDPESFVGSGLWVVSGSMRIEASRLRLVIIERILRYHLQLPWCWATIPEKIGPNADPAAREPT